MDLRFLQSFIHVVEFGSIAEAARRLDLAPSSVAQRIQALESDLGVPLVMRAGRTVKPTAAGSRMIEHARYLLHGMEELRAAASSTDLPAGPLRIGSTPTGLAGYMPMLLQQWVARYPQIEIFIDPGPTALLYSKVLSEQLDAALIVRPPFTFPKSCLWHTLRTEQLILLTSTDLNVKDVLNTVRTHPYIWYDRNSIGGKLAEDYLKTHDIKPNGRFELDDIAAIARLVGSGLGVCVLPDWTITGPPDTATRRWGLPSPIPHRTVGVIWSRASARAALVEAFLEPFRQDRRKAQVLASSSQGSAFFS